MPFEKLTFQNNEGDQLSARLDLPEEGAPIAYALFAHCFTCSKNLKAVGHISRALTREGFAVLRFDFTGLGESEGDFGDTNFSSNVSDLVAAAGFLKKRYAAPKILIGHSLGGAAVLQAAGKLDDVVAVSTIGAPFDPTHVKHLFAEATPEIEKEGKAVVNLAGRSFTIKKQFLDDLEEHNVTSNIRALNRALLVFHSPVDGTVGVDNAARIFEAAKHPKSFVSLDRADHLLSSESDSKYVGAVLAAWASKYIEAEKAAAVTQTASDEWVVTHIGNEKYRTDITARGHTIVADEPLSLGGTNLGPTPYDLLNAGLGACTVITMRMYADRKGWPLESVTARVRHEKVHAKDCEECESDATGKIDRIDRQITIEGPLDEDQIKRLMNIANKCPVHRTLEGEIHVITERV